MLGQGSLRDSVPRLHDEETSRHEARCRNGTEWNWRVDLCWGEEVVEDQRGRGLHGRAVRAGEEKAMRVVLQVMQQGRPVVMADLLRWVREVRDGSPMRWAETVIVPESA